MKYNYTFQRPNLGLHLACNFDLSRQKTRSIQAIHDDFNEGDSLIAQEFFILEQSIELVSGVDGVGLGLCLPVAEDVEQLSPLPVRDVVVFPNTRHVS